ncbi:very long chain fatty acid elongase 7 [Halyomorpha halys]|uniref:very long chain fatty acid elongase 7 n=1 Tax=Halyomorpha halys TaxID=286706 RepID=UPI0006D4DDBE|nr:elongation of very long chain fatty acids protein 7-like [Halyomorpha halys]XP_024218566.1 elongation of very long chain fatty acids protein 7-like [Halyomorpha halys]XP_024218567.1 elongation of very long chain fatty acids protein 7-like [Halyomorpha halys]
MAATVLNMIREYYYDILNNHSDPRVKGWPLMDSPLPMLLIGGLYYFFIRSAGPRFMEKRPPYKLERIMVYYNTLQIIVNSFAVYQGIKVLLHPSYSISCSPVTYETTPFHMKTTYLSWIYFAVKVLDLLDTVFMVLRKNFHQVTFLHVYHHLGMAWGTWVVVKYIPGAHLCFVGLINCIVHSVMYFYYLLTAYDPTVKKSIWWKKHITEMQMIQFLLIFLHHLSALINPTCDYPKVALIIFLSQNFLMFYLFSKFYYEHYIKPRNKVH